MNNTPSAKIELTQEIKRKLIHLSSLWIPILYCFIGKSWMIALIIALTAVVVGVDVMRKRMPIFGKFFDIYFARMLREHEGSTGKSLTGASYLMIAASLTILLFPKEVAIIALSVLMISDSAAAIVGRIYGKTTIGDKTTEGSFAFAVSALIVIIFWGIVFNASFAYYIGAVAATIAATIIEIVSKPLGIDDNFSIPLTVGLIMVVIS